MSWPYHLDDYQKYNLINLNLQQGQLNYPQPQPQRGIPHQEHFINMQMPQPQYNPTYQIHQGPPHPHPTHQQLPQHQMRHEDVVMRRPPHPQHVVPIQTMHQIPLNKMEEKSEVETEEPISKRLRPRKKKSYVMDFKEIDEILIKNQQQPGTKKRKRVVKNAPRKRQKKSDFMVLKEKILFILKGKETSFLTIREITDIFSKSYADLNIPGNKISNAVHHLCKDGFLEKKYIEVEKSAYRRGVAVVFCLVKNREVDVKKVGGEDSSQEKKLMTDSKGPVIDQEKTILNPEGNIGGDDGKIVNIEEKTN